MKKVSEHIAYLKTKPHHVRRKVAAGIAGGASGVIALVWLVGSITSGSFAVPNNSFADLSNQKPTVITTSPNGTSGLAGAAAAVSNSNAPAHIEIVDTGSSASNTKPEQTRIPF